VNTYFLNPRARNSDALPELFSAEDFEELNNFHPQPTPLHRLQQLASVMGISNIFLKDESSRCGLNSFKILGVTFAFDRLMKDGRVTKGSMVVCATEGNHGRAVARVARQNGLGAKVYLSRHAVAAVINAIEQEGAQVVTVEGNYDHAVRQSASDAQRNGWTIVSDTAWPGYEEIPRLIMAGYMKLLDEAQSQWSPNLSLPDVVLVQAGVGGLSCAVVSWLCHHYGEQRPYTIVCEPAPAACHLESARAGSPVSLPGPYNTVMAGLRAGEVSSIAWPTIASAADAFVAIDDEKCIEAVRALARPLGDDPVVVAGPSGACGLGTLFAILQDHALRRVRENCGLTPESRVLVINTEGATDSELHERIVA
jgi:diaminopropionate ammonia-lyase